MQQIELAVISKKICLLLEVKQWLSWSLLFLFPSSLAANRSLKISATLLLQHLKKSRRKRMIITQIALRNTRRARRAQPWPSLPVGLPVVRIEVVIRIVMWKIILCHSEKAVKTGGQRKQSEHRRKWNGMLPQADISIFLTSVTDLNHGWSQRNYNIYFGQTSIRLQNSRIFALIIRMREVFKRKV